METIYLPREDSYLLQKYVESYCKKGFLVLDMGTGSGIQAITAAKKAKAVIATDINREAIKFAQEEAFLQKLKNIKFIESDLFSKIPKKKFDLIIFNPPYLPEEKNADNIALFSAKRGTETTTNFIDDAVGFLAEDGIILLTGSTLAKQALIDEAIKRNLLESEMLESEHIFFEDIIIFKLVKSETLKRIESLKIKKSKIFAHGKRGLIIKGSLKNKAVAIKIKKPGSNAIGTIDNETRFLKILNKKGIGPKLIIYKDDLLVYHFVEGEFIFDFFKNSSKKDILIALRRIFSQMYTLDRLGINKFEMHHPFKHILISNTNPVLIDFERARYTEDPKNVTQFCDFLVGGDTSEILREKGIKIDKETMINCAKNYKHKPVLSNYKKIKGMLK